MCIYCKTFHHKHEHINKENKIYRNHKHKEREKKRYMFYFCVYEWRRKTNVLMYVKTKEKKDVRTFLFVRIYRERKEEIKKKDG